MMSEKNSEANLPFPFELIACLPTERNDCERFLDMNLSSFKSKKGIGISLEVAVYFDLKLK